MKWHLFLRLARSPGMGHSTLFTGNGLHILRLFPWLSTSANTAKILHSPKTIPPADTLRSFRLFPFGLRVGLSPEVHITTLSPHFLPTYPFVCPSSSSFTGWRIIGDRFWLARPWVGLLTAVRKKTPSHRPFYANNFTLLFCAKPAIDLTSSITKRTVICI